MPQDSVPMCRETSIFLIRMGVTVLIESNKMIGSYSFDWCFLLHYIRNFINSQEGDIYFRCFRKAYQNQLILMYPTHKHLFTSHTWLRNVNISQVDISYIQCEKKEIKTFLDRYVVRKRLIEIFSIDEMFDSIWNINLIGHILDLFLGFGRQTFTCRVVTQLKTKIANDYGVIVEIQRGYRALERHLCLQLVPCY